MLLKMVILMSKAIFYKNVIRKVLKNTVLLPTKTNL